MHCCWMCSHIDAKVSQVEISPAGCSTLFRPLFVSNASKASPHAVSGENARHDTYIEPGSRRHWPRGLARMPYRVPFLSSSPADGSWYTAQEPGGWIVGICVGALLCANNRIFLGKRAAGRSVYPDAWDIPGGIASPANRWNTRSCAKLRKISA